MQKNMKVENNLNKDENNLDKNNNAKKNDISSKVSVNTEKKFNEKNNINSGNEKKNSKNFQKNVALKNCKIHGKVLSKINTFSLYKLKHRNKRIDMMIICALIGLIACLFILAHGEDVPGEAVGIISTVTGIFGACLKDVYSFEFGSSRGSKEKDEHLIDILSK